MLYIRCQKGGFENKKGESAINICQPILLFYDSIKRSQEAFFSFTSLLASTTFTT